MTTKMERILFKELLKEAHFVYSSDNESDTVSWLHLKLKREIVWKLWFVKGFQTLVIGIYDGCRDE
jgi:hypothetical protein